LAPAATVSHVDAAVLTGGSAFGLASADGVMQWCEEHGLGVVTSAGRVPIVPALGLYDLAIGDPAVRPGPDAGHAAAAAATDGPVSLGRLGAGTGARVGLAGGPEAARSVGLVGATARVGDLVVASLAAVNAVGTIDVDGGGVERAVAMLADPASATASPTAQSATPSSASVAPTNTTIGVVVTNARLDKAGCLILAQGAHDGLARAIAPPHTRRDGDAFIAAATGMVEADLDVVRLLAVATVERAIREAGR
jgi:L-aminopeptidase/D-esterase-like protein